MTLKEREFLEELKKEMESLYPGAPVHVDPLSLSIACHIGPGALALACCKRLSASQIS